MFGGAGGAGGVRSVGNMDHLLRASVSVDDALLVGGGDDGVGIGDDEDRGRVHRVGVGEAVEVGRNGKGEGASDQPEIPPAVTLEEQRTKRRRVVQDEACDRAVGGDVQSGGGADAAGFEDDGFVAAVAAELVVSSEGGRRDGREAGAAGGCAVAGVVDGPYFDREVGPVFGEEGGGELGAGGVAGEGEDVGLRLRGRGGVVAGGEDLDMGAGGEWNFDSRQVRRVEGVCSRKQDEAVGEVRCDQEEKEAVPPYRDRNSSSQPTAIAFGRNGRCCRATTICR